MPDKEKADSLESLQAELEKAERKKKYYEQQEKILTRKVIPKLTRAERTNRLCTRAGMLESFLVHPELLSNDQVMDLLLPLPGPQVSTQHPLLPLPEQRSL